MRNKVLRVVVFMVMCCSPSMIIGCAATIGQQYSVNKLWEVDGRLIYKFSTSSSDLIHVKWVIVANSGLFLPNPTAIENEINIILQELENGHYLRDNSEVVIELNKRTMPQPCSFRGTAYPGRKHSRIELYVDMLNDIPTFRAVLAHEISHIIFSHNISEQAPKMLNEGYATLKAEKTWSVMLGVKDIDTHMKYILNNNMYMSLEPGMHRNEYAYIDQKDMSACISFRNMVYTEWASFVDFLIKSYGVTKFRQLSNLPHHRIEQPVKHELKGSLHHQFAYGEVYGSTFEELKREWIRSLTIQNKD